MPLVLKPTALQFTPIWPWWEGSARLSVCSIDAFAKSKEAEIVAAVESIAREFGLPLTVEVAGEERRHATAGGLFA